MSLVNYIEQVFYHTWNCLYLCAINGIVINDQKFQFYKKTVTFTGLTNTLSGITPSSNILSVLSYFCVPQDITGAQSLFGLVNQVAWALSVSGIMQPFRELIKPNNKFLWTAELDKLFGWQLTYTGSRFRTPTEKQYSPTDGEAAASCLNSAKMSVVGCQYLIVITDHKPLLSIFNNRDLCTIMNPQISKSKEKKNTQNQNSFRIFTWSRKNWGGHWHSFWCFACNY